MGACRRSLSVQSYVGLLVHPPVEGTVVSPIIYRVFLHLRWFSRQITGCHQRVQVETAKKANDLETFRGSDFGVMGGEGNG